MGPTVQGKLGSRHTYPSRITRDDVAARAGVSSATVSYVVNGGPKPVAPQTRTRVLAAIDELGYHPDAIARSLRSRRSHVLGLVVPDNANAFFAELALRVEEAAHARGYGLLLCNSREDVRAERDHLATLRDRRVDGIVLVPADATDSSSAAALDGIPVLALDRVPAGWEGDAVRTDGRAGGRLAVEHLLALGHHEIGFVHGPLRLEHARERLEGGLDALRTARIAAEPAWRREGAFDYAGGKAAALALLLGDHRPTALCCGNDALAVGALAAAYELGARVPGDLSVTGFDDVPLAAYSVPPLTTVAQPYAAMAAAAMELLLARVERHLDAQASPPTPAPPERRTLPVGLRVRESTAASLVP